MSTRLQIVGTYCYSDLGGGCGQWLYHLDSNLIWFPNWTICATVHHDELIHLPSFLQRINKQLSQCKLKRLKWPPLSWQTAQLILNGLAQILKGKSILIRRHMQSNKSWIIILYATLTVSGNVTKTPNMIRFPFPIKMSPLSTFLMTTWWRSWNFSVCFGTHL